MMHQTSLALGWMYLKGSVGVFRVYELWHTSIACEMCLGSSLHLVKRMCVLYFDYWLGSLSHFEKWD